MLATFKNSYENNQKTKPKPGHFRKVRNSGLDMTAGKRMCSHPRSTKPGQTDRQET